MEGKIYVTKTVFGGKTFIAKALNKDLDGSIKFSGYLRLTNCFTYLHR